ncbi:MAG: aminotransferase class I/II-fold pyridoxal phosphate-dependent enzyme [Candidatus Krumholzibacteriia bacterium]
MTRLALLPPYLFAEIDLARRAALAAGRDIVDLGIGDPDRPTPAPLVEAMAAAVRRVANHRYPANPGGPALREALADWLRRRHGVTVDPGREILALIGSKEGLGHLPLALLEEGDEALVPDPGYPVYGQATVLAGGRPVPFTLRAERGFRPDWDELEALVTPRTRLLFLNYPHNPTGATADAALLRRAVAFGARHGIAIVQDAAYLEVAFGAVRPASLLAHADLRRDRVIELHSFSKMFNMTGWRIGFAAGNAELVRDLARVKETLDSGVFTAVQEAVTAGLGEAFDGLLADVLAPYPPRRALIVSALAAAGVEMFPADATFYVWARVPGGGSSLEFCRRLLDGPGVVVTPGVGFGPAGEGWFRISLTAPDERIAEGARRLRRL